MSILHTLFGSKRRQLLGLDISSSAVKLVELSRRGASWQLEAYAIEPLPPGAVADKQIADPNLVAETIARAVSRSGSRIKDAAVAVSGASVISKIVQMPGGLSEHDLEEQIKVEADQYIPYPIDEVNLDFQVLTRGALPGESVDVLLAACRKDQVLTRSDVVERAELKPVVVDVEAYALENACRFLRHQMPDEGRGRTVAVVDMGATTTTVLVLHDNEAVWTRDQNFGGRQLTEDVMRAYGMSYDDATRARRYNQLPMDYHTELLPHFVLDMAQQIDRSLQFFFASSSQHAHIDQILLAGGCTEVPGVEDQIRERLRIATVIAQPFGGMTLAPRIKASALAKDAPSLLIAAGLAWRAFEFEAEPA